MGLKVLGYLGVVVSSLLYGVARGWVVQTMVWPWFVQRILDVRSISLVEGWVFGGVLCLVAWNYTSDPNERFDWERTAQRHLYSWIGLGISIALLHVYRWLIGTWG